MKSLLVACLVFIFFTVTISATSDIERGFELINMTYPELVERMGEPVSVRSHMTYRDLYYKNNILIRIDFYGKVIGYSMECNKDTKLPDFMEWEAKGYKIRVISEDNTLKFQINWDTFNEVSLFLILSVWA